MSSSEMPELGSKISLISKADIRYEGKLYTVDPEECTIALANVRSFGTEDRQTAHPVPAQNQIYDYILFRASDIKDISVVPPTQLLYDPAILQLSAMGSGGRCVGGPPAAVLSAESTTSSYHPVIGGIGNHHQYPGFNPMQSNLQSLTRPSPSEFLHQGNNDLLSGSRSSTPGNRKPSPTVDQSTQANVRKENSPHKEDRNRNQHPGNRVDKSRNFRNEDFMQNRPRNNYTQQSNLYQNHHQQSGMSRGGIGGRIGGGVWGQQRSGQQQQGILQSNNRTRGQRPQQSSQRQNFARAPGASRKQPLKFESDYDFDKANNEFEELRSKISNMKIDAQPVPVLNGEDKKDDSGNETAIANEVEGLNEDVFFYNKTKSFFDNISCEAVERSKGGMFRGGQRGGYFYQGGGRGNYGYGGRGSYRPFRQNKPPARPQQQPQVANA